MSRVNSRIAAGKKPQKRPSDDSVEELLKSFLVLSRTIDRVLEARAVESSLHEALSVFFEGFERGSAELAKLTERNRQLEERLATLERAMAELAGPRGGGQ